MTTLVIIFLLLALSVIAARHLQRTFFYQRPRNMPNVVADDITTAIHRFEAALAQYAPDVLSSLQPGLPDEQIAAIETSHRLRLTDELRALYRWRNGSPRDARIDLVPGHRFVPLDEAARTRVERRRELRDAPFIQRMAFAIFAGHRTGWLDVLDDGAGDGYFYDPARRRVCAIFYHFAEDRSYRFFPSLANFLAGAAECYETEIYRIGQRGNASENFVRSFALWPRYSSSPGSS